MARIASARKNPGAKPDRFLGTSDRLFSLAASHLYKKGDLCGVIISSTAIELPMPSNIPQGAIDCWILNDDDVMSAIKENRPFCEYVNPYNYFFKLRRLDSATLEGYIGRRDYPSLFHDKLLTNFTYFKEYQERKPIYVTFDRATLYRVKDIYPDNPLLFTLQRASNTTATNTMINQEEIYQLLFNEKWADIINILYKNKAHILTDPLLTHAAQTFENQFTIKLKDYPVDDKEIVEVLKSAMLIQAGRFYSFSPANYRTTIVELAKRLPLKEAYNYAKEYSDDPLTKDVIDRYERAYFTAPTDGPKKALPTSAWTEIFNRLFELINIQSDPITYFSGPRFISLVREVMPYHPDYTQFIQLRNEEGKSTSRKVFYYDILMDADVYSREAIIDRVLSVVQPSFPEKAKAIQMIMGKRPAGQNIIVAAKAVGRVSNNPVVFISYSWDDDAHVEWVLKLAERLRADGVDVILDRYNLRPGKSLPHFIEQSIASAQRILMIFTPNYRLRADGRAGGVGYEYSIINAELYRDQINNEKVIPILRKGPMSESIPSFMQQYIHINLTDDENFEAKYTELIRDIYDEPAIKVPEIGTKPTFE